MYDVYYHLVKFQRKALPMHGEIKKTNCIGEQFEPKYNLGGKMNYTVV